MTEEHSSYTVTWKDEDEVNDTPVGPCLVLRNGKQVFDMGWMTKHAARKIAEERHCNFEEV